MKSNQPLDFSTFRNIKPEGFYPLEQRESTRHEGDAKIVLLATAMFTFLILPFFAYGYAAGAFSGKAFSTMASFPSLGLATSIGIFIKAETQKGVEDRDAYRNYHSLFAKAGTMSLFDLVKKCGTIEETLKLNLIPSENLSQKFKEWILNDPSNFEEISRIFSQIKFSKKNLEAFTEQQKEYLTLISSLVSSFEEKFPDVNRSKQLKEELSLVLGHLKDSIETTTQETPQ